MIIMIRGIRILLSSWTSFLPLFLADVDGEAALDQGEGLEVGNALDRAGLCFDALHRAVLSIL